MALRVRLTVLARNDLEAIRDYLLPRSPQGAENVRLAIESTIDRLAEFPGIGRHTNIPNIRVITTIGYPFRIYHRVDLTELVILHVRHASRREPKDLPS